MEDIFCVQMPQAHELEIKLYSMGGIVNVYVPCALGNAVEKIIYREFERRFDSKPKAWYRKGVASYKEWDKIREERLKACT